MINDLRGMIASGHTAQRKVDDLVDRWGARRFRQLSDAAKDLSEGALREKLALLPDGIYECQEWIEYDGHGAGRATQSPLPADHQRGTACESPSTAIPQIDAPVVGTPAA